MTPVAGNTSSSGKKPSTPVIINLGDTSSTQASVSFTPSSYVGKGTINYTVSSNPGSISATGSSSPILVPNLTTGTSYTFTVKGTTNYGVESNLSSASNSLYIRPRPVVTGGTRTSDATYYYHTFTSNGTLSFANARVTDVEWLVVGGGAGSTYFDTYAGGGGGVAFGSGPVDPGTNMVMTIGSGGAGNLFNSGSNGQNSSILIGGNVQTLATGGTFNGQSGTPTSLSNNNPNGKGENYSETCTMTCYSPSWGYYTCNYYTCNVTTGGGGGAGGVGGNANSQGANGGLGRSIFGSTYGAGASVRTNVNSNQSAPAAGGNNTGNAGESGPTSGANGGSGIIIVRYQKSLVDF